MAARIRVEAPGGASYTIHIARGALRRAAESLGQGRGAVVTNSTLAPLYEAALAAALPGAPLIVIPDGESYKTLETTAFLYDEFVRCGLDRASTVIAFGGGVVGDTAGFAAATYMRGVRLVQVPTSLLAMVDSSVGGKVGVDLRQGKNLVGAFKQPDAVLIDPDMLATLPDREWRCGMAEVIKHGLLADASLLNPAWWGREQAETLIERAVQVKVDVVQADPYEQGLRATLNLGHTFGHAVELVSGYVWSHGEAVGFGLVAAARLSAEMGLCGVDIAERVEAVVRSIGLPTRLGGLSPQAVLDAMATDKKWQSGRARFILLKDIGRAVIRDDVPLSLVLRILEALP